MTHLSMPRPKCCRIYLNLVVCCVAALSSVLACAKLPEIAKAPTFVLLTQENTQLNSQSLLGNVQIVTFIFTQCGHTCPVLTAKLMGIQRRLAGQTDRGISFVAITVDPERDTPDVLKEYAERYQADVSTWAFLTGNPTVIREVANAYGVAYRGIADQEIDHTFLTSIVDQQGVIRVQYLGTRFSADEFADDVLSLFD